MRGSSAIALSIGIGALIGAVVMGVPAIRAKIVPPQAVAKTVPVTDPAAPAVTTAPPIAKQAVSTDQMNDLENVTPEPKLPGETPTPANAIAPAAPPAAAAPVTIDVKAALQDRVLGNPDAPTLFIDYSSLSCPHCADFHTKTLLQIRRDYIDTGKVKMIFRPFPLNEPALLGEKIARCVPQDQYFKMLDLLFTNQEKWVFATDVKDALRQITKVAGVTDGLFDACMANAELEKGIMQIASDGVAHHNLKGTPSFIFGSDMPNAETVAGELPYPNFAAKLDALISGKPMPKDDDASSSAAGAMSTTN